MNPALRSSAAHVVVDDIEVPVPSREDEHHLVRVLRLRDGERISVTDGRGSWRPTVWSGGALVADGAIVVEPEPRRCTIATAAPKGDRLDWMVQKLTEVGVSEVRLVQFERSVVRWDAAKAVQQVARLERISREAAMQSRRVWLPRITGPVPAAEVLGLPDVAVADPDGDESPVGSCVVVGPEGGFTTAELSAAPRRVRLGDTVLRVETAALVAAVRSLTGT